MDEVAVKYILVGIGLVVVMVWGVTNTYSWIERWRLLFESKSLMGVLQIAIYLPQILNSSTILPLPQTKYDAFFSIFGLIIYIQGAILAIWAKLTMGKSWGIPAQHDISKQERLITNGPFSFTRNPIYLGLLIMLFGFELALRSFLIILVFPLYIMMYRLILTEEKLLERHFGEKYLFYKSRVSRFIK